ncbi:MAG: M28 family peptidase [Planctomycetes bacterium]|nr:M28 family peptidase [Planctomycetota bacterium]
MNYLLNDLYTHDGDERCFGPQHDLAQQRIRELFESFGLETSLHPFEYSAEIFYYNVVGVHQGISCPNEIYVLGAHYDSAAGSPGAWDNASGVAAVLEVARVLSQHAFEATIVFIAFDREEQGSFGSAAYVNDHINDRIHGMINLDAIAWRAYGPEHPNYNKISLFYASEPTRLINDLASAAESWAGLTCVLNRSRLSDHEPFDDAGFAAAFLYSYGGISNAFNHTSLDSIDQPDYIDYDLGTRVTQAVVGYLATEAKLASARILPDFDGDEDVDIDDCCLLIEHWKGSDPRFDIAPPPNGDGVVNDQDLDALLYYWLTDRSNWWSDFGLIAHWKLDEIEGTVVHDSAGYNDAYVIGDPVWLPEGGMVDGALQLDGIDDYVNSPFVLNPTDGKFSVFVWIKGGAPGQVILSQESGVNWLTADAVDGALRTDLRTPENKSRIPFPEGPPLICPIVVADGDWHRVGFVRDGSDRILYVDDIEVASDTATNLESASGGLYIGAGSDLEPGAFWSGLIDNVRIYNRAVAP